MNEYNLEHILSFTGIGSAAPDVIGPAPEGTRVTFHNAGGEVVGARIRGTVRPNGGDWMTIRRDGVAVMDARVTFETDDKALILARTRYGCWLAATKRAPTRTSLSISRRTRRPT